MMRGRAPPWLVRVCTVVAMLLGVAASASAAPGIAVLRLDGTIQPGSLRYLERGLRVAADDRAALVLLELNTPGGTLVSLRSMVTAIIESPVPVVTYVTPAGARAASAGFFLLMAADVAAMAPGTNTGAAHPVALGAAPPRRAEAGDVEVAMAVEDAAALVRSLAAARGRAVVWAEKAVRESRSFSAEEARERGLVEIVAPDSATLLRRLDGYRFRRFNGERAELQLNGATPYSVGPTRAERLLMVIADPQVAYLLLMLGLLGVVIELLHPGAVLPGVAGGISLLLAFYAFSVLPVSGVGALLLLLGLGLFVAEAFITSHGLLALGGVACFVLGSLLLIETPIPSARVSLAVIAPTAVVLAAVSLLFVQRAWRLRRAKPKSGPEALVGELGELTLGIAESQGEGKVFVRGEYWAATSDAPLPGGARVRIEGVEGIRVRVAPSEAGAALTAKGSAHG
jgi:membrane-bound serine protease (ClpP class)